MSIAKNETDPFEVREAQARDVVVVEVGHLVLPNHVEVRVPSERGERHRHVRVCFRIEKNILTRVTLTSTHTHSYLHFDIVFEY